MKTRFKATRLRLVAGFAFAALPLLAVTACSHSDGPSESQIAKVLTLKLPDGLKASDVDIQVAQNEGTRVEPRYETRSNIELEFTDDIYKVVGHLGEEDVVKKIYSRGDDIKGVLITVATPQGDDAWNIQIKRIDIPDIDGTAKSKFQPGSYVEQGSSDYDDLKAKLAQEQKQAQEQAQKAAEAQAQAAREKADQEARDRAANIARLSELMKGTWAARYPMFHNGSMWASGKNHKLGIELTFNDTDDDIGDGTGVLYDFESPGYRASVPVGYKLDPAGRFVTLNFTRNLNLGNGVDFAVRSGDSWQMTPDGKLSISGNNGTWVVQMERDGPVLKKLEADVAAHDKYQASERALILQYKAANAGGSFRELPLDENQYGLFFVVGRDDGDVWGDGFYWQAADIGTAAVHAGLLKPGEAGIVKISKIHIARERYDYPSTTRNGITSKPKSNGSQYGESQFVRYRMSLVKALPRS